MAHNDYEMDPELSEIMTKLWNMDTNACIPGKDYEIDIQGYVTSAHEVRQDRARYNLFSWLNEESVFERPTYKAFRALLDNYESETGEAEQVTSEERKENWTFIYKLMETSVMQEAHKFLVSKGKAPEDEHSFRGVLHDKWFKLYRRSREYRCQDSCGFEHVFVGETREHEAIGFHNWIQYYLQEKHGHVDYKGYFRRGTANEEQPCLMTLQFTWKDVEKPIGSSFIGTSPEFEVALYTIIHLMGKEKVKLQIADYEVDMTVFSLGKGIGTAYPKSNE